MCWIRLAAYPSHSFCVLFFFFVFCIYIYKCTGWTLLGPSHRELRIFCLFNFQHYKLTSRYLKPKFSFLILIHMSLPIWGWKQQSIDSATLYVCVYSQLMSMEFFNFNIISVVARYPRKYYKSDAHTHARARRILYALLLTYYHLYCLPNRLVNLMWCVSACRPSIATAYLPPYPIPFHHASSPVYTHSLRIIINLKPLKNISLFTGRCFDSMAKPYTWLLLVLHIVAHESGVGK